MNAVELRSGQDAREEFPADFRQHRICDQHLHHARSTFQFAAALRELHEETNVSSVEPLGEHPRWLSYDLPPEAMDKWKGKYIGQTQRWFALRFTGDDSEIDIHAPGGGKHKPEFDEWRWEKLSALPDLIVPFKREVYLSVVDAFTPFATR